LNVANHVAAVILVLSGVAAIVAGILD
jgi:hypothetical protein